jgi:UDP-N-acetyl-D-glucosamine dehydrogenase
MPGSGGSLRIVGLTAEKIERREARVGVIGMGYVGLPVAIHFAEAGFATTGFDTDPQKVRKLGAGESYIRYLPAGRVSSLVERGLLTATDRFAELESVDAILICVPTPLTENREPDLSFVTSTVETISRRLRPGQLVVLESTTYPGTTREVVLPLLARGGEGGGPRTVGRDFYLAYSPEREDPNNREYSFQSIPKLVGGCTPQCGELARALYDAVVETVVPVSSPEVAEAAKLLENVYRTVNIALVNELKLVFERMGIDVWEVIDAAKTKPFGFTAFHPGPGLGGHCIPIDPFYLTWRAKKYEFPTRFIELAGEVNTAMPRHVVGRVMEALNERGKSLKGSRVLIVGVSYKRDVDDTRESPALVIIELLEARGAVVEYHDPYVPHLGTFRRHAFNKSSRELTGAFLRALDVVIILTDHSLVDYEMIVRESPLIVDTRNATSGVRHGREKIVKA